MKNRDKMRDMSKKTKESKEAKVYFDEDADIKELKDKIVAVIGYGNQGRSQSLNMRDSGVNVIIGNREDEYKEIAEKDEFEVLSIPKACEKADIIMLLIPDEIMVEVIDEKVKEHLTEGKVLSFASGYNIAFNLLELPENIDIILLAPRMIGPGVRELFNEGFYSFIGVHQDFSKNAKEIVLALAKAIGSTRKGVIETTMEQEAHLDLFTEQCFGPAFGQVLMASFQLLKEEGYPVEAILVELYMSGELSYTWKRIAKEGFINQMHHHSRTSQYGSISRGMYYAKFMKPIKDQMKEVFDKIVSGDFTKEWQKEQRKGEKTLKMLLKSAQRTPLAEVESKVQEKLRFDE
ncbi:MAG: ketol-acid reductoisomerase [Candidatus Lokiarchaeota archaeon]|nr:ketol-acid reductoisomerase [Candidatus Lokiarchaeota archaeon]